VAPLVAPVDDGHGPRGVVAAEQVQHHGGGWFGVVLQQIAQGVIEGVGVHLLLGEITHERFLETVVHDGVKLIALQPRGSVVPDFATM